MVAGTPAGRAGLETEAMSGSGSGFKSGDPIYFVVEAVRGGRTCGCDWLRDRPERAEMNISRHSIKERAIRKAKALARKYRCRRHYFKVALYQQTFETWIVFRSRGEV